MFKRQPVDLPHHGGERSSLLDSFCAFNKKHREQEQWDIGLYVSGLVTRARSVCVLGDRSECLDRSLNNNYTLNVAGRRDEIKNAFFRSLPPPPPPDLPSLPLGPTLPPVRTECLSYRNNGGRIISEFFSFFIFRLCVSSRPPFDRNECSFNDETNSSAFVFICFRLDFYSVENGRWSGSTMGEWTKFVLMLLKSFRLHSTRAIGPKQMPAKLPG